MKALLAVIASSVMLFTLPFPLVSSAQDDSRQNQSDSDQDILRHELSREEQQQTQDDRDHQLELIRQQQQQAMQQQSDFQNAYLEQQREQQAQQAQLQEQQIQAEKDRAVSAQSNSKPALVDIYGVVQPDLTTGDGAKDADYWRKTFAPSVPPSDFTNRMAANQLMYQQAALAHQQTELLKAQQAALQAPIQQPQSPVAEPQQASAPPNVPPPASLSMAIDPAPPAAAMSAQTPAGQDADSGRNTVIGVLVFIVLLLVLVVPMAQLFRSPPTVAAGGDGAIAMLSRSSPAVASRDDEAAVK